MMRSSRSTVLYHLLSMALISLSFASQSIHLNATSSIEINRDVFVEPKAGDKNIFFFEGACARNSTHSEDSEDKSLRLDITQACAVESAARANPEMSVFVFSSCPLDEDSLNNASRMVQEIFTRHANVFVWHQSLENLFNGTDLKDFFYSGRMFDSPYKTQTSNVARVVLLQKFGGIYLDLDFIVRRSLSELSPNFAGLEDGAIINNAALGISMDEVGRKVADMFVEEINKTFDGSVWGQNGPRLTTRVLRRHCNLTEDMPLSVKDCEGFTLYHPDVFYPIHWNDWPSLYEEEQSEQTLAKVKNSYAVHLWNSATIVYDIEKFPDLFRGSKQPKIVLQQNYCPISYAFNKL